ncbi:MAG: YmdB family metallophosphoesterase [Clostridia bacterium]|nr:YmdB family metallophosphoesterase [Clostridia bacterium]
MKILAIGDVVGEQALHYLATELPRQRRALGADLVIVNGENVCDVRGISPTAADALIEYGADILTSGNHVFDRRDIYDYLDRSKALLRPINYPAECPGEGARIVTSADGWRVLVINVSGCAFMDALANPFASVEHALDGMRGKYDLAVLDVHAEATSEKIALARYFDGRIAVIFGTHTHVATADEQVLPNGTGYITDLGMTGPVDGILGVCAEDVIFKSRTHLPRRFTVASGEIRAHGALFEVDPVTSKAKSVKRVVF